MLTEEQRQQQSSASEQSMRGVEDAMLEIIVDALASLPSYDPMTVNAAMVRLRPKLARLVAERKPHVLEAVRGDLEAGLVINAVSELIAIENAAGGE